MPSTIPHFVLWLLISPQLASYSSIIFSSLLSRSHGRHQHMVVASDVAKASRWRHRAGRGAARPHPRPLSGHVGIASFEFIHASTSAIPPALTRCQQGRERERVRAFMTRTHCGMARRDRPAPPHPRTGIITRGRHGLQRTHAFSSILVAESTIDMWQEKKSQLTWLLFLSLGSCLWQQTRAT